MNKNWEHHIMTKRHHLQMTVGLGILLLAGCGGTEPVHPDQEVALQPGDGVAAVVFDTLDSLNSIVIKSPDHKDQELSVGFVDKGIHMLVFEVPAGTYCLSKFHTGFYVFTQKDQTHGICWDVVPGKVAYSGNLAPRAYGQDVFTGQNYDWAMFKKNFKEQYPKLANFPIVTP
jgi:hypothetical protein